ncbi:hypothetical protein BCR37DRAFT_379323 [Protomyces lactucae-debilis]|uniref:Amine oxidase domain-containing protein n=1 Tax=Protomyces lactucae-debilis TaxID=2754530 RepID=A0A1Y2FH63_PROLT|nr:uncharacterized protein BCR37DRAFT_379323 [Protomyces lactucae-debilis]ORY83280.1 hypothetical protein BCR37DRAFT_379323 [Protomyces lactucae-debilis]
MLTDGSTDAFKALLVKQQLCQAKETRVTGQPGLNAFAKAFAKRLPAGKHEILTRCTVSDITYDQKSSLFTVSAELKTPGKDGAEQRTFSSKGVILTAPVPQTINLIKGFKRMIQELDGAAEYSKSIILLLWPKKAMQVDELKDNANIHKVRIHLHIQANVEQGAVPLSVHATPAWSEAQYEETDIETVENRILDFIGQSRDAFDKVQLKKWRYSQPLVDAEAVRQSQSPSWRADPNGSPLFVASDALGPGLIGEAGTAGIQAAEALHQRLGGSKSVI